MTRHLTFSPNKMKEIRTRRGISLMEISRSLNTNRAASLLERGLRTPTLDTINKLADVLSCDALDLMDQGRSIVQRERDAVTNTVYVARGTKGVKVGITKAVNKAKLRYLGSTCGDDVEIVYTRAFPNDAWKVEKNTFEHLRSIGLLPVAGRETFDHSALEPAIQFIKDAA